MSPFTPGQIDSGPRFPPLGNAQGSAVSTGIFGDGRGTIGHGINGGATVTPTVRTGYIPNPGMGFQGFNESASAYPQTVLYRRGVTDGYTWAAMNPASGVYDFSKIDADLAYVAANDMQLALRVYTMRGESFGGHAVPQWVIDAGAIILSGVEPDYRSRVYQQKHAVFADELRKRYDGNPWIAWVDIAGYGEFNQWISSPAAPYYATQDAAAQASVFLIGLDGDAHRSLLASYAGGSATVTALEADGTTQTSYSYTQTGFQYTQLLFGANGLWAPTRYVLNAYPNVGMRNDNFPATPITQFSNIGNGLPGIGARLPVLFETATGAAHDYTNGTAEVRALGASIIHDLNGFASDPEFLGLLVQLGYRYVCETVTFKPTHTRGTGPWALKSVWRNDGLGKAYPRMGQTFRLEWALLDSGGTVRILDGNAGDVSSWAPTSTQGSFVYLNLDAYPAGTYTVLAGVRDVRRNKCITLGSSDPSNRADGRLAVGTLTIT